MIASQRDERRARIRRVEHAHAERLERRDALARRLVRDDDDRHVTRRARERAVEREPRRAVEHDAERRHTRRRHAAHGQLRIVGERRADADGHRVAPGAQTVHLAPRRGPREPAWASRVVGERAVE